MKETILILAILALAIVATSCERQDDDCYIYLSTDEIESAIVEISNSGELLYKNECIVINTDTQ